MYAIWEGIKRLCRWCVIASVCWWTIVWMVGSWRAQRCLGYDDLIPTADRWLAALDAKEGR